MATLVKTFVHVDRLPHFLSPKDNHIGMFYTKNTKLCIKLT